MSKNRASFLDTLISKQISKRTLLAIKTVSLMMLPSLSVAGGAPPTPDFDCYFDGNSSVVMQEATSIDIGHTAVSHNGQSSFVFDPQTEALIVNNGSGTVWYSQHGGGVLARLQADGNLVVRDVNGGTVLPATGGTGSSGRDYKLVLTDKARLAIIDDTENKVYWVNGQRFPNGTSTPPECDETPDNINPPTPIVPPESPDTVPPAFSLGFQNVDIYHEGDPSQVDTSEFECIDERDPNPVISVPPTNPVFYNTSNTAPGFKTGYLYSTCTDDSGNVTAKRSRVIRVNAGSNAAELENTRTITKQVRGIVDFYIRHAPSPDTSIEGLGAEIPKALWDEMISTEISPFINGDKSCLATVESIYNKYQSSVPSGVSIQDLHRLCNTPQDERMTELLAKACPNQSTEDCHLLHEKVQLVRFGEDDLDVDIDRGFLWYKFLFGGGADIIPRDAQCYTPGNLENTVDCYSGDDVRPNTIFTKGQIPENLKSKSPDYTKYGLYNWSYKYDYEQYVTRSGPTGPASTFVVRYGQEHSEPVFMNKTVPSVPLLVSDGEKLTSNVVRVANKSCWANNAITSWSDIEQECLPGYAPGFQEAGINKPFAPHPGTGLRVVDDPEITPSETNQVRYYENALVRMLKIYDKDSAGSSEDVGVNRCSIDLPKDWIEYVETGSGNANDIISNFTPKYSCTMGKRNFDSYALAASADSINTESLLQGFWDGFSLFAGFAGGGTQAAWRAGKFLQNSALFGLRGFDEISSLVGAVVHLSVFASDDIRNCKDRTKTPIEQESTCLSIAIGTTVLMAIAGGSQTADASAAIHQKMRKIPSNADNIDFDNIDTGTGVIRQVDLQVRTDHIKKTALAKAGKINSVPNGFITLNGFNGLSKSWDEHPVFAQRISEVLTDLSVKTPIVNHKGFRDMVDEYYVEFGQLTGQPLLLRMVSLRSIVSNWQEATQSWDFSDWNAAIDMNKRGDLSIETVIRYRGALSKEELDELIRIHLKRYKNSKVCSLL